MVGPEGIGSRIGPLLIVGSIHGSATDEVRPVSCASAFEAAQRLDMESFARYDAEAFRGIHHPDAISVFPSGRVVRGRESILDALAEHFTAQEAIYTWRELHRFVDGCRAAFVLYETSYEVPSSGYRQRALTGVAYVHDGGRWLAIADQGSARPAVRGGAADDAV
jgi:hypothetical protein